MLKKIKGLVLRISFCLLMLTIPTIIGAEPAQQKFQHFSIEIKNSPIDNIIIKDLDNDPDALRRDEIIIQQGKEISVYTINSPAAGFKLQASFRMPDEVFVYDLEDINGDKIRELVVLMPDGVSYFPFKDGGFISPSLPLLKTATVFVGALSGEPLFQHFVKDLDDDGDNDFIIPAPGKFVLAIQKEPGRFEPTGEIPIKTDHQVKRGESLFEPLESSVFFPATLPGRVNEDKRDDLIIFKDNAVSIYYQDNKGWNSSGAGEIDLSLVRRKKKKVRAFNYDLTPLLGDINADNLTDVVISHGGKGVTGVYLNKKNPRAPFIHKKPDLIKRIKGWTIDHELTDLNSDGRADLVLVQMKKVSVLGGLRMLLAHSVNWKIAVYLARTKGNKIYPASPDYSRSISVPFTLSLSTSSIRVQTPYLISFTGDFNGDNLKDFFLKDSFSNKVKVYFGNKKRVFNKSPNMVLDLSQVKGLMPAGMPYAKPIITDLNNDGISDIVVHQQDFEGKNHLIEVFISK